MNPTRHERYIPSPLAKPRPKETPVGLKIGRFYLTRDEFGQISIYDGIRGHFPDEGDVEHMLEAILENRWKKHVDNP